MTPSPLAGKTALITGSSGGLGLAMAEGLAGAGCGIVLHGLAPVAEVQPLQDRIAQQHGVPVSYLQVDLSDADAVASMVDEAVQSHGGVDVLVNNAVTRHFGPLESLPRDAWEQALAVNLSAPFHAIRACLPHMRQRGWGRILNMTSAYGVRAVANRIDYVTTKAALLGMTRAVALETVQQGITCNAICPGSVHTPSIDARLQELAQAQGLDPEATTRVFLQGKQPTGRFVEAGHVAALLVFLCSAAGRDITGAMLPMEGGWLAG